MSIPAVTTVLVVGATGFIGRQAADRLFGSGFRVLGTSTGGEHADLACDLLDPLSIERVLKRAEPDAVLLAAGNSSVGAAWNAPDENYLLNTAGPFNLLEAVRLHKPSARVTLVSSASVYGPPESAGDLPFRESSPIRPASPYGASKAAAEVLAGQYSRGYGLKVAIARVFNQIGPGQSEHQAPSEFARDIAIAEARGVRKLDLRIGNPEAKRDFTDVRDSARALTAIIGEEGTGTFNICSGQGVRSI